MVKVLHLFEFHGSLGRVWEKNATVYIKITEKDSINWVLKRFKRQCESFGVLKEYRKRKAYRKPSERLKEKREAAEKRRKKESGRVGRVRSKI